MVVVPAKATGCSEQPGRITGATRASPKARASRPATSSPSQASVPSGRCGPCCSVAARHTTARVCPAAMAASISGQVIRSRNTSGCSAMTGKVPGRHRSRQRPDLLEQPEHVELGPVLDDLAVGDADDVDTAKGDLPAGGRDTHPLGSMGTGEGLAGDDLVALDDHVVDGDLVVRKGSPKRHREHLVSLPGRRQARRSRVVDEVRREALLDDLVDAALIVELLVEPTNQLPVLLFGHRDLRLWISVRPRWWWQPDAEAQSRRNRATRPAH